MGKIIGLLEKVGIISSAKADDEVITTYYKNYNSTDEGHALVNGITIADPMNLYDDVTGDEFAPREGYDFVEWNTERDGTGTSYEIDAFIGTSGLVLYAIWTGEEPGPGPGPGPEPTRKEVSTFTDSEGDTIYFKDSAARSSAALLNSKIGNANGIAELDSTGKVPTSQLPEIDNGLPDVTTSDNGKSLNVIDGEWAVGSIKLDASEKGAINGVATLDGSGLIPSNQLPSYVDDVLEYASQSSFPATGELGKIYVATDTNKSYRWSGSTYVELSSYALATQAAAGLMSAADKTKLDGIDCSTLRPVPFAVAVSDWSGSSSFTANFLTQYVTNDSIELIVFDGSLADYAKAHINSVKKSGGGGITFTTAVKPTGTVTGTILIWANDDGKIPVLIEDTVVSIANGGTGQSSLAGAQQALGITALSEKMGTEVFSTFASQSALESALVTLGDSLSNQQFKNIRFSISPTPSSGPFSVNNGFYIGTIIKSSTNRYVVIVQCDRKDSSTPSGDIITGSYYNSTWVWHNSSDEIELLNRKLQKMSKMWRGWVEGTSANIQCDTESSPVKLVIFGSDAGYALYAVIYIGVRQSILIANSGGIIHPELAITEQNVITATLYTYEAMMVIDA